MRYLLADVELTGPLPALELEPDHEGVGLLLRVAGRPAAFVLRACAPGARLDEPALRALIGDEGPLALRAAEVRDRLAPPSEPVRADVTVAVCTHGRADLLAACLDSVLALRGDDPARFEVLVVDNAPPDDAARELVAALPGARYAIEPRPGLDFARNRALAEAHGTWIAFLDDDVVVDPGWLAGLEEALTENPDAGAVTGLVLPAELESEAQIVFERRGGFRRGFRKLRYEGEEEPGNPLYPVGAGIFGAGCNMALRRDAVLALGGFDPALDTGAPLPGGGDLDIFHRVVRAGLPLVYEPRMLVRHRHRRDRGELRRQYRTWGEGFIAFLAKTYAADASQRPKVRAMLAWWAGYEIRELARSSARRGWGAPDLAAAELLGGAEGLIRRSYARSVRRTRAIEARHA